MNNKLNAIKRLFICLMALTALVGCLFATACGKPGDDSSSSQQTQEDYTVTFYYGFEEEYFDEAKNEVKEYKNSLSLTSKNGEKIVLKAAQKNRFEVAGYDVVGYSTTEWQKDGINDDMNVFVKYKKKERFTVTFKHKGVTIKEESFAKGTEVDESLIPKDFELSKNEYFLGWTNKDKAAKVEESFVMETIIITRGINKLSYEAEEAQTIDVKTGKNKANIYSAIGTGKKSLYFFCSPDLGGYIEYEFVCEKDITVILTNTVYARNAGTYAPSDMYKYSVKHGAEDYEEISFEKKSDRYTVINEQFVSKGDWDEWHEVAVASISLKKGENKLRLTTVGDCKTNNNLDYITFYSDSKTDAILHFKGVAPNLDPATVVKGSNLVKFEAEDAQQINDNNGTGKRIISTAGDIDPSLYFLHPEKPAKSADLTMYMTASADIEAILSLRSFLRVVDSLKILEVYDIYVNGVQVNKENNVVADEMISSASDYGEYHLAMVGKINLKKGGNVLKIVANVGNNLDYVEFAYNGSATLALSETHDVIFKAGEVEVGRVAVIHGQSIDEKLIPDYRTIKCGYTQYITGWQNLDATKNVVGDVTVQAIVKNKDGIVVFQGEEAQEIHVDNGAGITNSAIAGERGNSLSPYLMNSGKPEGSGWVTYAISSSKALDKVRLSIQYCSRAKGTYSIFDMFDIYVNGVKITAESSGGAVNIENAGSIDSQNFVLAYVSNISLKEGENTVKIVARKAGNLDFIELADFGDAVLTLTQA